MNTAQRKMLAEMVKTSQVPDTSNPAFKELFYGLVDLGYVTIEGLGFVKVTRAGKAALKRASRVVRKMPRPKP